MFTFDAHFAAPTYMPTSSILNKEYYYVTEEIIWHLCLLRQCLQHYNQRCHSLTSVVPVLGYVESVADYFNIPGALAIMKASYIELIFSLPSFLDESGVDCFWKNCLRY